MTIIINVSASSAFICIKFLALVIFSLTESIFKIVRNYDILFYFVSVNMSASRVLRLVTCEAFVQKNCDT